MLNALTIDVEDYYQVSAFESVIRFEDWNQHESRIEQNTNHVLDILEEYKAKATFFMLGWVAELTSHLAMVEFPLTTFRLGPFTVPIAGGGYLRLMPIRFVRWAIQQIHKQEKEPVVIYLHPWELDFGQPRLRAHWASRFRHYLNLQKTEGKFTTLLSAFSFAPMREVLTDRGLLEAFACKAGQAGTKEL